MAALIGAGATMVVSALTLIVNVGIDKIKVKGDIQWKEYETKREHLNDVYKKLISIINLYPNESPNDILEYIDDSPHYLMEYFDSVLKSLDYQIKDYKKQLDRANIDYEQKNDINMQISNREYAKKKISKIRDRYLIAKNKYKTFCESDKVIFDLYAGQEVQNRLVEFEVVIHNVFISGEKAGYKDDPINNILQIARRNLVNSIRKDIGIS